MRRIGALVGFDDPDIKAFQQELARLGWSKGRNLHIDHRYAPAGANVQALAKELVAPQPDVLFAQSRPVTAALQKETDTIPIVFTFVIDPVGAGFVASLPRPGSNLTGFMVFEPSVIGKWLEMLKAIAPKTTRVAILANPKTAVYYDYLLQPEFFLSWTISGIGPLSEFQLSLGGGVAERQLSGRTFNHEDQGRSGIGRVRRFCDERARICAGSRAADPEVRRRHLRLRRKRFQIQHRHYSHTGRRGADR